MLTACIFDLGDSSVTPVVYFVVLREFANALSRSPALGSPGLYRDVESFPAVFVAYVRRHHTAPELSMGWVDPWIGLGWVESTTAKVLKI